MKTAQQLVADAKANITEISVEQAEQLHSQAAVIIDTREPEEYAAGHLQAAVSIPRGLLEFKIGEVANLDADSPIIIYCQAGGRAALAAQTLQDMGFGQVSSIAGGYDAWMAAGKPTVQPKDAIDSDK